MTRETRIGLVVGLGFILLFGLVLSELMAGRSSGPGAGQDTAMDVVREPALPAIVEQSPPEQVQPILVAAEAPQPVQGGQAPAADQVAAAPGATQLDGTLLAAVSPAAPQPAAEPVDQAAGRSAAPGRVYTVQDKDSLIKIARMVYGPQHEREYRRILRANSGVLKDESVLRAGQTLMIPPLPIQAPTGPSGTAVKDAAAKRKYAEMDAQQLARHFSSASAKQDRTPSDKIYVVRSGDTLAKIARRTLNDPSRAAAMRIYKANKDRLSDPDNLPVNAKLRIPT